MSQFSRILYITERHVDQKQALSKAISLAQRHQAQLTILDVIPAISDMLNPLPSTTDLAAIEQAIKTERQTELESLLADIDHDLPIHLDIQLGKLFLRAIELVLTKHYDLLIKPAENPSWVSRLFGSEDMHLLRKCPCPVLLLKSDDDLNYDNVLATVDFDATAPRTAANPLNQLILSLASDMALADKSALHVLHCWQSPDEMLLRAWGNLNKTQSQAYVRQEKQAHQTALQSLSDCLQVLVGKVRYDNQFARFHLLEGRADKLIPQAAKRLNTDLLVMGTLARTGINGLFIGNTAESVFEQVNCSVLVVKPKGFVSPVSAPEH